MSEIQDHRRAVLGKKQDPGVTGGFGPMGQASTPLVGMMLTPRTSQPVPSFFSALLVLFALEAAGCSDDGEQDVDNSNDESPDGTEGLGGSDQDGSEPDEEDTDESSGAACLVGDWVLPEDEVQRFYDALA